MVHGNNFFAESCGRGHWWKIRNLAIPLRQGFPLRQATEDRAENRNLSGVNTLYRPGGF